MNIEIKIPDIGSDEVEVIEILVKINEKVKKEQGLLVIEGQKASTEIPSPVCGVVKQIMVQVGDKVKTNSLVMLFHSIENDYSENKNEKLYLSDFNNQEKLLLKKNILKELNKKELLKNNDSTLFKKENLIHATPVIRRIARELNINLKKVVGTGRKGRILKEDLKVYVSNLIKKYESNVFQENNNEMDYQSINFKQFGKINVKKINKIQCITAINLTRNWRLVPHVTQFEQADITKLEIFRQKYNKMIENKSNSVKVTLLAFIVKIIAKALKQFPYFNSSFSNIDQELILKKYINIGIAVDTPNGLFVPVIKDAYFRDISEISKILLDISKKAHNKELKKSDMEGGSFTISNLGGIGGNFFTPIINVPEVAILGISKSLIKPIWNNKKFVPKLILPLSLSYDHRVINGADAVRFITFVKKLMSDMYCLLM